MSLPEIPDEALVAAFTESREVTYACNVNDVGRFRDLLGAAWPHLYAAALRHGVAVLLNGPVPDESGPGIEDAATILRGLADEATP